MIGIVMVVALVSVAIGVTSYRYSSNKVKAAIKKIERPDLINIK